MDIAKSAAKYEIRKSLRQEELQKIFEYTASIFDEIMIDDFLFTDCECDQCQKARGDKTWADYRCSLMIKVGRQRILKPARAARHPALARWSFWLAADVQPAATEVGVNTKRRV
ncbi:MAG: hypothetical protein FVQ85_12575 [Planctomycetes bacterium]|nr:hypothetical protein [Planctomycetota bacterium]